MPTEPNPTVTYAVPTRIKLILVLLTILVFLSLGLNWYLIQQWQQAREQISQMSDDIKPVVQQTFDQVDSQLETFQHASFEFNIRVNQQLPIRTSIPFSESVDIPVKMMIPIKDEIKTTVMMDPFQAGLQIPVDIAVPLDLEFPVDEVVAVAIKRDVPISTSVPLSLTVPISIAVSDTNLPPFIDQLRTGIQNFEKQLNQSLSGAGP